MGTAARGRDAHVEELVRSHRFDEALRDLYEARDAAPDDVAIATAIRSVRERQLRHRLEQGVDEVSPVVSITERTVIVADGNGSQATLTRTMLRLALGAGARMITVASAAALVSAVEKHRADLLVVELTLPGSDGLAAMRAVRKAAGAPVDTIIVAQRSELAYVETLPERAVLLARPIERSSLLESLEALGVAGARGRG